MNRLLALPVLTTLACNGAHGVIDLTPADKDTAADAQQAVLEALEVRDIGVDCGGDSGPSRSCHTLEITCEGLVSITAEIRVTEPPKGAVVLGTVIVGSGGDGSSWWNSGTDDAVEVLRQTGHRMVERRWLTPWMEGEQGFVAASCRYAGVLKWVHETLDDQGPHCAVGNSVGATEVATFLLSRPESFLLDGAVLQSGPPLTALDLACLPEPDSEWAQHCEELFDDFGICRVGERECTVHQEDSSEIPALIDLAFPGTPCQDQDASALRSLQEQSTWPSDTPAGSLPVPVRVLLGSEDCVEAVPFGLLYAELAGVEAAKVDGANHKIQASDEGVAALQVALGQTCFSR